MNEVVIDVETTGLNPWQDKLLGVSIAWEEQGEIKARWWPWHSKDQVDPFPHDILGNPDIKKIGHNIRFDIKFLTVNGISVKGAWEDTKLIAQLLDENRPLGLKPLSTQYIGKNATINERILKRILKENKLTMKDLGDPRVPLDVVAAYCNEDTTNTLKLYKILGPQIKQDRGNPSLYDYYTQEMLPLEKVLMDMEIRGNRIDLEALKKARETLRFHVEQSIKRLESILSQEIDNIREERWVQERNKYKTKKRQDQVTKPAFNWNSNPQKIRLFYDYLNLGRYCSAVTKTGSPSLSKVNINPEELPDKKLKESLTAYYNFQGYQKMLSTYAEGIHERLVEGRIHGEYYQATKEEWNKSTANEGGTVTGRLSHRNPNLGNLPRSSVRDPEDPLYWKGSFVKDLFIPEPGYKFIYADYSQIELRVAAFLSQDKNLLQIYYDDVDAHQQTADALGITRQQGKTVNFLLIYYGSAWRLAIELGWDPHVDPKLREAEEIRRRFFNQYPQLHRWIQEIRNYVYRYSHVRSFYGRVRRLPEIKSHIKSERKHAFQQAGNMVVQTTAASICKRAMIELHRRGFVIVNQVHDSIYSMVRAEEAEAKLAEMTHIMTTITPEINVPLKADGKILDTFME